MEPLVFSLQFHLIKLQAGSLFSAQPGAFGSENHELVAWMDPYYRCVWGHNSNSRNVSVTL